MKLRESPGKTSNSNWTKELACENCRTQSRAVRPSPLSLAPPTPPPRFCMAPKRACKEVFQRCASSSWCLTLSSSLGSTRSRPADKHKRGAKLQDVSNRRLLNYGVKSKGWLHGSNTFFVYALFDWIFLSYCWMNLHEDMDTMDPMELFHRKYYTKSSTHISLIVVDSLLFDCPISLQTLLSNN